MSKRLVSFLKCLLISLPLWLRLFYPVCWSYACVSIILLLMKSMEWRTNIGIFFILTYHNFEWNKNSVHFSWTAHVPIFFCALSSHLVIRTNIYMEYLSVLEFLISFLHGVGDFDLWVKKNSLAELMCLICCSGGWYWEHFSCLPVGCITEKYSLKF